MGPVWNGKFHVFGATNSAVPFAQKSSATIYCHLCQGLALVLRLRCTFFARLNRPVSMLGLDPHSGSEKCRDSGLTGVWISEMHVFGFAQWNLENRCRNMIGWSFGSMGKKNTSTYRLSANYLLVKGDSLWGQRVEKTAKCHVFISTSRL